MQSTFKTSDLALSAYLKVAGLELLDVSSIGNGKAVFAFDDSPNRQQLVMRFFNHQCKVEPVEYMTVLKSLKGMATEMKLNEIKGRRYEPTQT